MKKKFSEKKKKGGARKLEKGEHSEAFSPFPIMFEKKKKKSVLRLLILIMVQ